MRAYIASWRDTFQSSVFWPAFFKGMGDWRILVIGSVMTMIAWQMFR